MNPILGETMKIVAKSIEDVPNYILSAPVFARGIVDVREKDAVTDELIEVLVTPAGRVKLTLRQTLTPNGWVNEAIIEYPSRARTSLVGVRALKQTVRDVLESFFD